MTEINCVSQLTNWALYTVTHNPVILCYFNRKITWYYTNVLVSRTSIELWRRICLTLNSTTKLQIYTLVCTWKTWNLRWNLVTWNHMKSRSLRKETYVMTYFSKRLNHLLFLWSGCQVIFLLKYQKITGFYVIHFLFLPCRT